MIRLLDGQLGKQVGDFWRTKKVFHFKAYYLLDATADSTFKNCTFYQNVFMWLLFISGKKSEFCSTKQELVGFHNRD
jgi:hypothetical protein